MQDLTIRQRQVYLYVVNYYNENGVCPSFCDIKDHFCINYNAVRSHMLALRRKGYLEWESNGMCTKSRATRIVRWPDDEPPPPLPTAQELAAGHALTRKQFDVFAGIVESTRAGGVPPTLRELSERFGFSSPNAVRCFLPILERKGLIECHARQSRGIRIVLPRAASPQTPPLQPGEPGGRSRPRK